MFFFGGCILDARHGQEVGRGTVDSILTCSSFQPPPGLPLSAFHSHRWRPGLGLPLQAALPQVPLVPE